jgi:hypothetical protein
VKLRLVLFATLWMLSGSIHANGCGWAEFFARPQWHFSSSERRELVLQSGETVSGLEEWILRNRSDRKLISKFIALILHRSQDYRQRAALWETGIGYYRILNSQFVSWVIRGNQGAIAYMGNLGELLVFRRNGEVWRARHWLGDSEVLNEESLPGLLEARLLESTQ